VGELTVQSLSEEELRCGPSTCAVGVAAKKSVGEVRIRYELDGNWMGSFVEFHRDGGRGEFEDG